MGELRARLVLCALSLLWGAFATVAHAEGLASQESALVAFKDALEHPQALRSWNPQLSQVCSGAWRGVKCNDARTSVTNLTLEGEDLTGSIPDDIRRMKFLKSLTIRKTAFLGAIPQAIADLRNLKNLIIASNPYLNGTFPKWILDLKNLERLSLAGNNLTGSLLGCNITNSTVPLTGTVTVTVLLPSTTLVNISIPNVPVLVFTPENVTLPTVVIPILWSSPITPRNLTDISVPPPLAFMCPNISLPSSSDLSLHTMNWTIQPMLPSSNWTIPTSDIPDMSPPIASIKNFTLPSDMSVCPLPLWNVAPILFNWTMLDWNISDGPLIDVPGFDEPLPSVNVSIPNPLKLTYPDAKTLFNFTNPFEGTKPPVPGTPPCDDKKDEKSQAIVDNIQNTRHLSELESNQTIVKGLPNLKFLDLSNNSFTGHVSNDIHDLLPNLNYVDLSNNRLEGNVPRALFKSKVKSINLANNYFSGKLPHMRMNRFDLLDVSSNCLAGIVPKKIGKSSPEFSYSKKCLQNSKKWRHTQPR